MTPPLVLPRPPVQPRPTGLAADPPDLVPLAADDPDSWEEPSGDGRVSRQVVLGVQLLDGRRLLAWIPYGAIAWGESGDLARRLTFEAVRHDTLFRVAIEGEPPAFQAVADKLLEGKRASVRVNGDSVTAIRVEAVPALRK